MELQINIWVYFLFSQENVFSIDILLLDFHLNWLNWLNFLIIKEQGGIPVILIDCMIFLSPFLDVCIMQFVSLQSLTPEFSAYAFLWPTI